MPVGHVSLGVPAWADPGKTVKLVKCVLFHGTVLPSDDPVLRLTPGLTSPNLRHPSFPVPPGLPPTCVTQRSGDLCGTGHGGGRKDGAEDGTSAARGIYSEARFQARSLI